MGRKQQTVGYARLRLGRVRLKMLPKCKRSHKRREIIRVGGTVATELLPPVDVVTTPPPPPPTVEEVDDDSCGLCGDCGGCW